MSNTEFYDSSLTTVDYQILFVKRDKEAILENATTVVAKTMSGGNFDAWKIAQFMKKLNDKGIKRPADWTKAEAKDLAETYDDGKDRIVGLKAENLEFLQVDHQVVSSMDRRPPKYEEKKTDALERIARNFEAAS